MEDLQQDLENKKVSSTCKLKSTKGKTLREGYKIIGITTKPMDKWELVEIVSYYNVPLSMKINYDILSLTDTFKKRDDFNDEKIAVYFTSRLFQSEKEEALVLKDIKPVSILKK